MCAYASVALIGGGRFTDDYTKMSTMPKFLQLTGA